MPRVAKIHADDLATKVEGVSAVVLDFYQESCPPCRTLEPRLERVAQEFPDVRAYRIDIDQDLGIARRFGVMSLPTLLLLLRGREAARVDGLIRDEQILELFESAKEQEVKGR